jgi:hypothetical protein
METITIQPKLPKLLEIYKRGKATVWAPIGVAVWGDVLAWAEGLKARNRFTREYWATVEVLRPFMEANPTKTVKEAAAEAWEAGPAAI